MTPGSASFHVLHNFRLYVAGCLAVSRTFACQLELVQVSWKLWVSVRSCARQLEVLHVR